MMKKMLVVFGLCFIAVPHAHAGTFNGFEQAFSNPAAVTTLSITHSERAMKHLPDRLGTLTNLKVLKIACLEELEDLPGDIGNLIKLEKLILHNGNGCRMNVSIPEEIGLLKSLKVLDLYGALDARGPGSRKPLPVKTLPNAIGQLQSLEKLNLGRNGLKAVPSQVAQLSKLKDLGLDYNEIHELPSFIGDLKNLRKLSVRSNGGVKLPQSLANLSGLRISMGNNSLTLKDQKILAGRFPGITFSFENEWDDATANEERPGK
ncbi:exported hypothetical protein [Syntrophobacter sp. SbD2]|nr:exported hypothetical protein [Syntrophobacter sp. SbD2]